VADERYELRVAPSAARTLAKLPEKVVAAVYELITGTLLDNPRRIGKPLEPPLAPLWSARRGSYRVLYAIDETKRVVEVAAVGHRADVYRR
jgi:mRNA interferase RelE/StbE